MFTKAMGHKQTKINMSNMAVQFKLTKMAKRKTDKEKRQRDKRTWDIIGSYHTETETNQSKVRKTYVNT